MAGAWRGLMAGMLLAGGGGACAWAQAPQVEIDHAAARLVVLAEPRSNVSLSVAHGASRLPPLSVRQVGGRVVVDGGLERPFGDGPGHVECRGGPPGEPSVQVTGVGRVAFRDLPVITAHVPLDARLSAGGAVFAEVGATRSLQLAGAGCGDWTVGSVQDRLDVALAGSGDVKAGEVGRLQARIGGSGDLRAHRVANGANVILGGSGDVRVALVQGPLSADVGGSGDVEVERVDGPVQASLSGSGDVRLKGGRASTVAVQAAGSAQFEFGGEAGRVQAATSGSGDIRIAHASGPVSQSSSGSGEVRIGR